MRVIILLLMYLVIGCGSNPTPQQRLDEKQQATRMLPGYDTLDAYQLKIANTYLFSTFKPFIDSFGLPGKYAVGKDTFDTKDKEEMLVQFNKASPNTVTSLLYSGIVMEYFNDFIVADQIDFRKTNKIVTYKQISFDRNYTFSKFKNDFPSSANPSFKPSSSLFEIVTKENGKQFKHFFLTRRTKADPNEILFVEFTFENNNLIFLCFVNVG